MHDGERVVITLPLLDRHRRVIAEAAVGMRVDYVAREQVDAEALRGASILLGNVPPTLLTGMDGLRWIQLNSAGTDGYMGPGVLPEETVLTNATGAYGPAVAEHAFAMLLALLKNLPQYRDRQREHEWKSAGQARGLMGSTVVIAGFGDIGRTFARLMRPFGSHIIGIATSSAHAAEADELYTSLDALDEVLPRADVALFSLPGIESTRHALSWARLAGMKRTAVVLNVGRGTAVDTDALCDAVQAGQIWGAGLDVVDPEPLPKEHRLWDVERILLTPHISGGFQLEETLDRIVAIFVENLRHYRAGERLRNEQRRIGV